MQIHAMVALPPCGALDFWSAFAAHHLPQLSTSLLTLSHSTQHRALSTHIQILSLIPNPTTEPYFRRFLTSSSLSHGLATRVAGAFIQGIEWKRPSGPGHICALINYSLVWGDATQSDDGKAPMSFQLRSDLARRLDGIMANPRFPEFPESQRIEMKGLRDVLTSIEASEGNTCLCLMREHLEIQMVDRCAKGGCVGNAELTCARCKSVRYCGKECQKWHWKNGHKLRCHQTAY
jgi:hypothetical protein